MDKPKPIRLKYIPTDMYAVRYFKEKPFIVPEGVRFACENVDFSTLNIELKDGGNYSRFFEYCKNCKIDTEKLKLNKISKNTIQIFVSNDNNEIVGELPILYDNKYYFYAWRLEKMTDEYVFELAEKISNMEIIDGKLKGTWMFSSFPNSSNFQTYDYGYNRIYRTQMFPILDLSKWDINSIDSTDYFFYNSRIYRLKMFVPSEVVGSSLNSLEKFDVEILENFDFSKFGRTEFQYSYYNPYFYIFYGKNLGANPDITLYYFTSASDWGGGTRYTHLENKQGEIFDRTTPEESKQSLIYTLIEHSFDRKTAGYPTCTIYLHNNTKSLLTSDEIAQITAKGFTIA